MAEKYLVVLAVAATLFVCCFAGTYRLTISGTEDSGVRNYEESDRLIDGNEDTYMPDEGCYHSSSSYGSWVQLDVIGAETITMVHLLNRNTWVHRIQGATISVCKNTMVNLPGECQVCNTVGTDTPASSWIPIDCLQSASSLKFPDYVRIEAVADEGDHWLQICEVHVYGVPTTTPIIPAELTVRLKISGTEDSGVRDDDPLPTSNRLIDGNEDTHMSDGGCYHSNSSFGSWVQLDVIRAKRITAVDMLNTDDNENQIQSATISVCKNTMGDSECVVCNIVGANTAASAWMPIKCLESASSVQFPDYVRIEAVDHDIGNGVHWLQLCEVHVYGIPITTLIQPAEHTVQLIISGTEDSGIRADDPLPSSNRLIDGNEDTHISHGGCYHSNSSHGSWVQLDVIKAKTITVVHMLNRDDNQNRIQGATISVCKNTMVDSECQVCNTVGTDTPASTWIQIACLQSASSVQFPDYIRIEALDEGDHWLHFCEVHVYGTTYMVYR